MGNTIGSIKSVVVTSIKGVFSRYVEFSEKCSKYQFERKSFPVVESIVNNGILFPCQVLVSSPIIIYGAVTNYPVTVASHCFTVFKLGVPVLSTQYVYTMALLRLGYNVPYFLYDLGKELSRKLENMMDPQLIELNNRIPELVRQEGRQVRMMEREIDVWNQHRERMEILNPPIRYDPPPVVRPHPAPWEIRTWG
jgi:hypothetical protein